MVGASLSAAAPKLDVMFPFLQGVTIGQADRISRDGTRRTGYPTIEDNVWIGPNAVIVGAITIGKGARILAGAVVTSDVPSGSLVGGNPSSIIREDVGEDVLNKVQFDV
jgi:serine O-acetyltransferase